MIERAYLDDARSGAGLEALQSEVAGILAQFRDAGAQVVEPASLLKAETLLDLYGEAIRARAYMTSDDLGEQVLRPDFTVPIVERHLALGLEPARYAYAGPVWRKQAGAGRRAAEYLQVGFEIFDREDPARVDAEVFGLISQVLDGSGLSVATGDVGLVLAAIDALGTSETRKAALRRHVWRPARFQRLLSRFGADHTARFSAPDMKALLDAYRRGEAEKLLAKGGRQVGLRGRAEVLGRIAQLSEEAETPALTTGETDLISAILTLKGSMPDALAFVRSLGEPGLVPAADQLERRMETMEARRIATAKLPFEGSYGRTSLEYYDGFVFGFYAPGRDDLPVIATGGRYDALTRVLGGADAVPAVGAIIRPEALLALRAT